MKIISAASAFPRHYYNQDVLRVALQQYWGDKLVHPDILKRLHSRASVDGRHLALPLLEYYGLETWGDANRAWFDAAEELGQESLCHALTRVRLQPGDLNALIFMSVTGVSSPSIDARLINRLSLSSRIRRVPVFGLGCVGGAAGISRAADYVRAYPDQIAALVSVETYSLTLQRDDLSKANLISSGLFGDGAASVLVAGDSHSSAGVSIVDHRYFLSGNRRRDGLGHYRKRVSDCIIATCSRRHPGTPRTRRGFDARGARPAAASNWVMDHAHRWP